MNKEELRLEEDKKREKNWKRWGPYLAERQWATVREDYSAQGDSWNYFPFSHAASRAYRWGEDGILGITDRECRLCFALAFWNGQDSLLKERLFGLVPGQGNHGEDVKECYYYLDSTPTHSYMKALYKYPQKRFPYEELIEENQRRGLPEPEYELVDTGIFDQDRYFDIFVEYAKNSPDDLLIKVTIANRSSQAAPLFFLPTLWMRNTWSWGAYPGCTKKQSMSLQEPGFVKGAHESLGNFFFTYPSNHSTPLFTDNETNFQKLFQVSNQSPFVKDAFHEYVIRGNLASVNPQNIGSKFAALYRLQFQGNETKTFEFRLLCSPEWIPLPSSQENIFKIRKEEADDFYREKISSMLSQDEREVNRQAFASLLWSKQFYHFVIEEWLEGDPLQPKPPKERLEGRNKEWNHLFCNDVISVPDKWEYPWFAAWDLAFHMVPFAKIDPEFAKGQILLFLREWYMHPNGQQPAYEYEFSDVNPPVHAWAAWRVYKMTGARGNRDHLFLESAFQKLLLNFTWWVNKKDHEGHNLFSGGFLGLDNIGVFDRSKIARHGVVLEQADGTAWMAFYCLTMLTIALELATFNPVYEDMASKFFEHFVHIADAINEFGGSGLWDEEDGFYYDQLKQNGQRKFIRTRSLVGLLPLIAVEILEDRHLEKHKDFSKRMNWFLKHRGDLKNIITYCTACASRGHRIMAIPSKERLQRMCRYLFDENEFLSPFGIRSLSKYYEKNPFKIHLCNVDHLVDYVPGESNSYMFGGNSNWRGPIWFPLNFLIIEALERYDFFYGETLKMEYPTGSGQWLTLKQIADDLSKRLIKIFLRDEKGDRPCFGGQPLYAHNPHWKHLVLFNEYFHAETGVGLGASHQTGWTALATRLLHEKGQSAAAEEHHHSHF
jgi:Glycosyl hydrolase family 63 C-terminal domain